MVEAKLVFGSFEAVLYRPTMPFDANKGFDGRTGRTPCGEEGEVTIGNVTADQQPSGPCAGHALSVFVGLKIGEFEIGPVMEALAQGAAYPVGPPENAQAAVTSFSLTARPH